MSHEDYEPIDDLLEYMDDGSDYDDGREGYLRTRQISGFKIPAEYVGKTKVYEVEFEHYDFDEDYNKPPATSVVQRWRVTVQEVET